MKPMSEINNRSAMGKLRPSWKRQSVVYRWMILIIFNLATVALAQSNLRLMGQVFDARSGTPLDGALIRVENSYLHALSDEDGFFFIENIQPGWYDISVQRMGYRSAYLENLSIAADQPQKIQVGLQPEPLAGDSVLVIASAREENETLSGDKIVLGEKELEPYRSLGVAQVLHQVAGVQVESSGGAGSRTLIKIHGGRANQVLVMLDGQRLNNPQTGEVDLSMIPLAQIERIEIVRQGNAALSGDAAFQGVVAFFTRTRVQGTKVRFRAGGGSFSTYHGGGTIENAFGSAGISGNYRQMYSRQNFPYFYEGEKHIRRNAWFRNRKFFAKLYYRGLRNRFSLLYTGRQADRGLPSTPFNEQLPADDSLPFTPSLHETVHALQFRHQLLWSPGLLLKTNVAYHALSQLFANDNPVVSRKERYRTQQNNLVLQGNTEVHFQLHSYLEGNIGITFLQEELDQQNVLYPPGSIGRKERVSRGMFAGFILKSPALLGLFRSVQLHPAIRYQKIFARKGDWFPFLGMSLMPAFFPRLTLSANISRAVRYPDFNSLFWVGDARAQGNPALLPEESRSRNLSIRYFPQNAWLPQVSLFYYLQKIDHLIFWHRRFDGVWEPHNEDRVEKRGWDLQLRQSLFPGHVRFQAAYSFIKARNKKADPVLFNKRLVFVPEHSVNLSLLMSLGNWHSTVVYRAVSSRETVASNSRGTQIPPYSLWNFLLTYRRQFGRFETDFDFVVKNITGENYQLISGYPMPGRIFQFNIQFYFNLKQIGVS